jgi:hypothetical protein
MLSCLTSVNVNEDGSANVSLELCNVCWKSLLSIAPKPDEWIENAVVNRARKAGDDIYKREVDRHLGDGTMPVGATKQSLILDYEIPVIIPS